ncbi:unnamed protein product [Acanthoscelides obtectus]|uniref:Uncharacterized protein n=1 Tax=Acanthoscelides obtectus TaxID=200917 RepID=A0A9P0LUW0_ACAOB|nr:unnamed protein product [Acanthoscelides obtectus]CAK1623216.1 hypothetical protein AOBTE_LOCUS1888 [Acanthoscelides obtectus]
MLERLVVDKYITEIAVATCLDIEGVPATLCQWIEANLKNRTITSVTGDTTIEAKVVLGCPQGGSLLGAVLVDTLLQECTAKTDKDNFQMLPKGHYYCRQVVQDGKSSFKSAQDNSRQFYTKARSRMPHATNPA